ncbi:MAG: alpha/beta hydrolase [Solirubrobacterales bacterium]|nr:alpha/beta hydrolase [Solirubrobacterales bacterium]
MIVEDPTRDSVRTADVGGGIEIAYETFGDPADPAMLLVMGLGMQMLAWDEEFCQALVDRGFHVIRYDNRDIGLSTKVGGGPPNVIAGALGLTGSARYTLNDMAADAIGLLDHLGVERAHVAGVSMGGMIGQTLASRHGDRVASLASIMSGPGGRRPSVMPRLSVMGTLLAKPPVEREAYATHLARIFTRIGSPGFDHDYDRLRQRVLMMYDRCFYPTGTARQLMAIMASGDRTAELRRIHCPTLVIHGKADKLMPPAAGEAVARAVHGSRLELIEGMGHDLPLQLWPRITRAIADNAARAKPAGHAAVTA